MRKRLWSPDEDEKLQKYVSQHGFGNWSEVAKKTGLQRCGKSCRLRWINYLRPDLKRGKFTAEEKMIIVNLQKVFGNSWSKIAAHLPGRTDSDIKNFWHSHFRKKRPQQLIPAHAAFLNSSSPASLSINGGPVAGLLTMPSSSSSSPPSTSIHQHQLAIPFLTMPLSSNISIDHDQAAAATLNLTTNVLGNHHDPHYHHHHHNNHLLSNLPHHDHPHLQSLPTTSMPCLEDLHDMPYPLKHAGISIHHHPKQDDQPQQHPLAMSSLHPSVPVDNTHQHDDLMSLIACNENWLHGNKLMVHEHGLATSTSTNNNNNNISSNGSDYSASSTSCSTNDSLQQTLYPEGGGPAPPDGLELVVWSCVNRPLQHDQLGGAHVDQVHPMTDDMLNYSDQEHNYTPFMDLQ